MRSVERVGDLSTGYGETYVYPLINVKTWLIVPPSLSAFSFDFSSSDSGAPSLRVICRLLMLAWVSLWRFARLEVWGLGVGTMGRGGRGQKGVVFDERRVLVLRWEDGMGECGRCNGE